MRDSSPVAAHEQICCAHSTRYSAEIGRFVELLTAVCRVRLRTGSLPWRCGARSAPYESQKSLKIQGLELRAPFT
jgi:hypothetical protein